LRHALCIAKTTCFGWEYGSSISIYLFRTDPGFAHVDMAAMRNHGGYKRHLMIFMDFPGYESGCGHCHAGTMVGDINMRDEKHEDELALQRAEKGDRHIVS